MKNHRIEASGLCVMRTPLLPFGEMLSWAVGDGGADSLRRRLREVVARPEVGEALFVASPSLSSRMAYWLNAPDGARGKRIEASLAAYYLRMCGRPTPYGLCAGITVGEVGASTYCRLAPRESYGRSTRIDAIYFKRLIDALVAAEDGHGVIPYRPNSSLYELGPSLRYGSGRPVLRLYSIEASEYIALVLERAEHGATRSQLAEALVQADPEIAIEEARAFIAELVQEGVLIADLEPPLTGCAPLERQVSSISLTGPEIGGRFTEIGASLKALDAEALGVPMERYETILRSLPRVSETDGEAPLLHTDLIKPGELAVGNSVVKELQRAMGVLHRICDMEHAAMPLKALRWFREAFVERYGNREVPLLEVLDDDVGIGLRSEWPHRAHGDASPILRGVGGAAAPSSDKQVGPGFEHLMARVQEAHFHGSAEIVIDDHDIRALETENPPPLPPSFFIMCSVVAPSAEAIDRGNFLVVWQYLVPGVRLLARFAHLDPRIEEHLRLLVGAQKEFFPNAILADIVHQPDSLSGNVMMRPLLYDYEIPFVGRSGAPPERQIHARDLLVSVEGERVVLRWRRNGMEVVPQVATAHQLELTIYADPVRFLSMLAWQYHGQYLGWQWRGLMENAMWLPRVRVGRTIVSLATWQLRRIHLQPLIDSKSGTAEERLRTAARLRQDYRLPRWISLVDGTNVDRTTPIDLENLFAVDELIASAARNEVIRLIELPAAQESDLWATGPEGRFQQELNIGFRVDQPPCAVFKSGCSQRPAEESVERTVIPGGPWLSFKLFTRRSASNAVLREVLSPLAGTVDRWFFLRADERDYYLRFFLHGAAGDLVPRLHALVEPMIAAGRCWKLELDTYQRDLETYGGSDGLLAAEQLAHLDSTAVLSILPYLDGGTAAELEWHFALMGIDRLCRDFQLSATERLAFARKMRDARKSELLLTPASSWHIGDHYRTFKTRIFELLSTPQARPPWSVMADVLENRSRAGAPFVEQLLTAQRDEILSSLIRQHAARVFRSSSRLSEAVIYDFLARHYDGAAARKS